MSSELPRKPRVLLLSRDFELGLLRQRVLQQAGCEVLFPEDGAEALRVLKADNLDVMVVAHTISRESGGYYSRIFRENNPQGRIVYVCSSTIEHPPEWADENVLGLAGPEELVAAVLRKS